jgi:hypothetical protein
MPWSEPTPAFALHISELASPFLTIRDQRSSKILTANEAYSADTGNHCLK